MTVLNKKLSKKRSEIINELKKFGVGTSIYYPGPIPNFKYYKKKYNLKKYDYPNALDISNSSIALPVGPHLSTEDIIYISEKSEKMYYKV